MCHLRNGHVPGFGAGHTTTERRQRERKQRTTGGKGGNRPELGRPVAEVWTGLEVVKTRADHLSLS